MGKNTNQIATFSNLADVGYRWFSGTIGSPDPNHCVIDTDLYNLHHGHTWDTDPWVLWPDKTNKALKWSDVPGSSKQAITVTNGIYNGYEIANNYVSLGIEEGVSGKTRATVITIYYNYKLSGSSTWNKLIVEKEDLGDGGNISGSASGGAFVPLNPYVAGTVAADYLSIHCGTTNLNQTWYIKVGTQGSEPSTWTKVSSGAKSYEYANGIPNYCRYASDIRSITSIKFRVE